MPLCPVHLPPPPPLLFPVCGRAHCQRPIFQSRPLASACTGHRRGIAAAAAAAATATTLHHGADCWPPCLIRGPTGQGIVRSNDLLQKAYRHCYHGSYCRIYSLTKHLTITTILILAANMNFMAHGSTSTYFNIALSRCGNYYVMSLLRGL